MHVSVNWSTVCLGVILLGAGALAAAVFCFLDSRRVAAEERRQLRAFERSMAEARLPDYDGATFGLEWPEDVAGYLEDTYVRTTSATAALPVLAEEPPVPPSTVSGPLPQLNDDYFIERLRADTAAFKAAWGIS